MQDIQITQAPAGKAPFAQRGKSRGAEHRRRAALRTAPPYRRSPVMASEHYGVRALWRQSTMASEHYGVRALWRQSTMASEHYQRGVNAQSACHQVHRDGIRVARVGVRAPSWR
eukprot:gene12048-biopygen10291